MHLSSKRLKRSAPGPLMSARGTLSVSLNILLVVLSGGLLMACEPRQSSSDLTVQNIASIEERNKLQDRLAKTQAELQIAKLQLVQLDVALAGSERNQTELDKTFAELGGLQNTLTQRDELIATIQAQLSQAEQDLRLVSNEKNELRARLEEITAELEHTQGNANPRQPLENNGSFEVATADLKILQEKISHLRAENRGLTLQEHQLSAELDLISAEMDELRAVLEGHQVQQEADNEKLRSVIAKNESLKKRLAKLEGQNVTLMEQQQFLDERLTQTTSELDQAKAHAAELSSDYEALLQERSELASTDKSMEAKLKAAKQSLEAAQTEVARLAGARGIYTVQEVDSLSSIAAFFYRDGALWPKILQANSFLVTNADLIFPGMVLIIP